MKKRNNSKKLAISFGVVAGLGLAAIPAFSYATAEVSGDVKIESEILSSLAMRIHSNADGAGNYGFAGYQPASAEGASDTAATAGPSLATGLTMSSNQADTATLYSDVEVRSNSGKFKLEVADADTDTALRNSTSSTTANEFIPAGVTTKADSVSGDMVIDSAVTGWALKGGEITDWTAIASSSSTPLTVKSVGANTTNPLAFSDTITVNYAVATGPVKTGIYNDVVTYTATALDSSALPACSSAITEGQSCSENGIEYIRLKDGNLWTKNNQGSTATWEDAASHCPSGAHLPSAAEFDTLLGYYGGSSYPSYGQYGYYANSSALHDATDWLSYHWSSTSYEGRSIEAYALEIQNYYAAVDNYNYKTNEVFVVCVR